MATRVPSRSPSRRPVTEGGLLTAAVLSGNRNFEGRINPLVRANYLASPPLVVAYALAGTMDIDLVSEPLGSDSEGAPVFLRDLWPSAEEVAEAHRGALQASMFAGSYAASARGPEQWVHLATPEGDRYAWDAESTYIKAPAVLRGHAGRAAAPV